MAYTQFAYIWRLRHPIPVWHLVLFFLMITGTASGQFFYPIGNSEYVPTNSPMNGNGSSLTQTCQYQVPDGLNFSSTDPTIIIQMECLAANNYGQWTTSRTTAFAGNGGQPWLINPDPSYDHGAGWFLLGNQLAVPSEKYDPTDLVHHPGCQLPGIISGGHFSDGGPGTWNSGIFPSTNPKATANLLGSVRYVWVESASYNGHTGNRFVIEGLNDERGTNTNPLSDKQIHIELDGLPNPEINTQIVRDNIFQYNYAHADNVANNSYITISGMDMRDIFDICCDTKYLYITWCSNLNQIFVTVVDITTGTTASAFATAPIQVSTPGSTYAIPTIACDPRGPYNINGNPEFGVAFVNTATNIVIVQKYLNATAIGTEILNNSGGNNFKQFFDPWHLFTGANALTYTTASRARIVVSSVAGSSSPVYSVYVLMHDGLILYNNLTRHTIATSADIAWYVDGILEDRSGQITPLPSLSLLNGAVGHRTVGGTSGIVDEPIIAFANPYDNQTGNYNQFHCMYQLNLTSDGSAAAANPLIIARGHDNGFDVNNPITGDTRLLLNQDNSGLQADPTSYIGAVNQMGIHMHWRSGTTHFYARNFRFFDEDIEESTLVTNECYLTDGRSHGGTQDATLSNGRKLTVWTDPNYGAVTYTPQPTSYPYSGEYWYPQYAANVTIFGQLLFTAYAGLTIGDALGDAPATLYTMPIALFFPFGNYGGITINPNCNWECYRSPYWSSSIDVPIRLQGLVEANGNKLTADLNIHGDAEFADIPDFFISDKGIINILYEPSIRQQNLSTSLTSINTEATGYFTLNVGYTTLTNSSIFSFIPINQSVDVMTVQANDYANPQTFTSISTDYKNLNSGIGKIKFIPGTISGGRSQDAILFSGGLVSAMRFHFTDPRQAPIYMGDNMTFHAISEQEIMIERTIAYSLNNDYGPITISGNSFDVSYNLNGGHDPSTQYGIYIKNFNNSNDYANLNITDNLFTYSSNAYCSMNAAIALENSTGNVMSNTISDNGYSKGIFILSAPIQGSTPLTKSYICSNTISNNRQGFPNQPNTYGIYSNNYTGIVNYNQLSGMTNAYVSGTNDNPNIVFTSILNCGQAGVLTTNLNTVVDFSGIHGLSSGSSDLAPYNTIKGNCQDLGTGQILLNDQSQIYLGKRATWWRQWGGIISKVLLSPCLLLFLPLRAVQVLAILQA
jgi:hypothetical protein